MNKKNLLLSAMLLVTGTGLHVSAQISQGGIPLSLQHKVVISNVPVSTYTNPDWDAFLDSEELLKPEQQFTRPFIVALNATADFGFPQSGQMEVTNNGYRVWRGVISVANAPAIGLAFDQFVLPKGVQLFVTNENKKQIAGAFDESNNDASGLFIVDAIQGSKACLELNIAPGVNIDEIKLHIDKAVVFHRAIEHLSMYLTAGASALDQYDSQLNGRSSVCMINAICATGNYVANPRKATIQTLTPTVTGLGLCSGTLINSAGNTAGSTCKPYIATATHCESTGETNNTASKFAQLIVRFNFERSDCAGTQATNGLSMTGVNLVARSEMQESWVDANNPSNIFNMKGDFMLYELKTAIPASYGAVLSGWKRQDAAVQTTAGAGKKFYGFHHPAGDNKKFSSSAFIKSYSWPIQQPDTSGIRWMMLPTEGYVSQGSSGSGLFDGEGYWIGITSVAGQSGAVPANCNNAGAGGTIHGTLFNVVSYQKLAHAWDYNENGIAGANSLKPFLDPGNTGVAKVNSVNATTCTDLTSGGGTEGSGVAVENIKELLLNQISVFPNPSNTGIIQLKYNFKTAIDVKVEVVDVAGRTVFQTEFNQIKSGDHKIDLSDLTSGIYVIKFVKEGVSVTKKIIINK